MTTRDEIEQAIDDVIHEASSLGAVKSSIWGPSAAAIVQDRVDAARARLLALLSPARPDGDVTISEARFEPSLSRLETEMLEYLLELARDRISPDEPNVESFRYELATECRGFRITDAALAAAHDRPGGEEATA